MSCWDILGIEPTYEISEIKKAYAKKLKITHPEDDSEGFQQLRTAYDNALKYSKGKKEYYSGAADKPDTITRVSDEKVVPIHIQDIKGLIEDTNDFEDSVEVFINDVNILYENFFDRIKVENWELLFNSKVNVDAMWIIEVKQVLSDRILTFLMERHYLPQSVWKFLDTNFNWSEQEDHLCRRYPRNFIYYILTQINEPEELHYCYFNESNEFDYDEFLQYREEANYALINKDYKALACSIKEAREIYPDDPDLLRILAEFYLRADDKKEALEVINSSIDAHPDFTEGILCRAKIYYELGDIRSALKDCEYIQSIMVDNLSILFFKAECHFKMGNIIKARKLIKPIYTPKASDNRAYACLVKFNHGIVDKFIRIFFECFAILPTLFFLPDILGINSPILLLLYKHIFLFMSLYVMVRGLWVLYSIGAIPGKYNRTEY